MVTMYRFYCFSRFYQKQRNNCKTVKHNIIFINYSHPYYSITISINSNVSNKILMRIFPTENYIINTGFWNLLSNPSYLKSIQTSMSMGVTLISGFILYTQNMYSFMNTANGVNEARASFIAYLSAPIILIITSSISLTILSSNKDIEDIKQLKTLGVSRLQLLKYV